MSTVTENNLSEKVVTTSVSLAVYTDTVIPDYAGDDNLSLLTVKKDVLLDWFLENVIDSFRRNDKNVSEEGLLDEWLDECLADETDGLFAYAHSHEGIVDVENM